ncbi:WYL domain-containing protein [Ideonella sp. 4Y11]|uniref:WYL domain-containing protein n=1 Tax=Ideonella aquatica TaxID=2824119 RepID=A0A940YGB8_9BURK|nr:WYL domain-containing protein [Ideonella aquatica]MBQ0957666.1 WYL domain-containing protein [Ideonella aquatica]
MSLPPDPSDDPDSPSGVPPGARALQARWRIHYETQDGGVSVRTVQISHLLERGPRQQILGHCETRGKDRAFRIDRIRRAYDLDRACRVDDPLADLRRACEQDDH